MKVTIWGAGGTGGSLAQLLYQRWPCEIALIDVSSDMAIGKAMDISQTASLWHTDGCIRGGDSPQLAVGSDVAVITAGIGRRPGLKRENLLTENAEIALQIRGPNSSLVPGGLGHCPHQPGRSAGPRAG